MKKKIIGALLIVSIIIVIKHSNMPVWNGFEFFLKPEESDGIFLKFAIGYIVSLIFYLIVVYYPEESRKNKIKTLVLNDLTGASYDIVFMLVSMYKSICSEESWIFSQYDDDKMLFDDVYYEKIKVFDAYSNADSPFNKRDTNNKLVPISWHDKISVNLEMLNQVLDGVLVKYVIYLNDDMLDSILNLKNSNFLIGYLGLPSKNVNNISTGLDDQKYADRISLYHARTDLEDNKHTPLFSDVDENNCNKILLKDFIEKFFVIRDLCVKENHMTKDIGIQRYCKDNCGKLMTSVIKF